MLSNIVLLAITSLSYIDINKKNRAKYIWKIYTIILYMTSFFLSWLIKITNLVLIEKNFFLLFYLYFGEF